MVRIIVCTLRGEPQQILSDEAVFSVEKLKEHLGVLDQGCFLSTIVHNNAALDDATDLAAFSQPVEVNLVQHASHWSPHLLSAARGPDISEVEGALRRFADPNSQDDNGWTALSFAACRGDIDMEPWRRSCARLGGGGIWGEFRVRRLRPEESSTSISKAHKPYTLSQPFRRRVTA